MRRHGYHRPAATRRQVLGGLGALGGTALGASLSRADERLPAPRYGGTLVVAQYQEPTVFDPNHQYSWETFRLDRHIYESLVLEDLSTPASEGPPPLIPGLAERWDASSDARSFTFRLRQGVVFHDGTPFNAEALKFNVRRFTDPSFAFYDVKAAAMMRAVYGHLAAFSVLDAHTVRFDFNQPFLEFLRLLPQGNYVSGVFSPDALQRHGQDGLGEHPCGTGPFAFVDRVRGDRTTLVRNERYWGARPYLDRIVFRPIPNDPTRLAAFETGEIDLLTRTPTDSIARLTRAGAIVHQSTNAGLLYMGWNFRNRFARNAIVRRAIHQAIDRDGMAKWLFQGAAVPALNIVSRGNIAYDPAAGSPDFNPDLAAKSLRDSGYATGTITFTIATDVANQPVVEWIQRDLGRVGIKVDILSQEWLTYSTGLVNMSDDLALYAMEWGFVTPYWIKLAYQGYVLARGGASVMPPEIGHQVERASLESDPARALELWKAAATSMSRATCFLPLLTFTRYFTSGRHVRGLNIPAQNFYDLSQVFLEAA